MEMEQFDETQEDKPRYTDIDLGKEYESDRIKYEIEIGGAIINVREVYRRIARLIEENKEKILDHYLEYKNLDNLKIRYVAGERTKNNLEGTLRRISLEGKFGPEFVEDLSKISGKERPKINYYTTFSEPANLNGKKVYPTGRSSRAIRQNKRLQ